MVVLVEIKVAATPNTDGGTIYVRESPDTGYFVVDMGELGATSLHDGNTEVRTHSLGAAMMRASMEATLLLDGAEMENPDDAEED